MSETAVELSTNEPMLAKDTEMKSTEATPTSLVGNDGAGAALDGKNTGKAGSAAPMEIGAVKPTAADAPEVKKRTRGSKASAKSSSDLPWGEPISKRLRSGGVRTEKAAEEVKPKRARAASGSKGGAKGKKGGKKAAEDAEIPEAAATSEKSEIGAENFSIPEDINPKPYIEKMSEVLNTATNPYKMDEGINDQFNLAAEHPIANVAAEQVEKEGTMPTVDQLINGDGAEGNAGSADTSAGADLFAGTPADRLGSSANVPESAGQSAEQTTM
eukprot:TRINITY_DN4109_c0_g1_i1.p2 TRINITY_DN4109_c0_g1~~TRINITY_DN4109_c0_g1_i1.p2  ORF type:complete len:272 (-),score=92.21 TRINITY_DN4109_c0_g1_i1:52-867(-)